MKPHVTVYHIDNPMIVGSPLGSYQSLYNRFPISFHTYQDGNIAANVQGQWSISSH